MAECLITRRGREVSSTSLPEFTYTGNYSFIDDGEKNWRIKFLTSGVLTFTKLGNAKNGIDVFLVGGGCAGGSGSWDANNGYGKAGSGGYTKTQKGIQIAANTAYNIVVGAGGQSAFASGGNSSAFSIIAAGGTKLGGGSGGGAYGNNQINNGGSDGGNGDPQSTTNIGADSYGSPGKGQGTTTREFGESTGDLYAGGGGAGGNGSARAMGVPVVAAMALGMGINLLVVQKILVAVAAVCTPALPLLAQVAAVLL